MTNCVNEDSQISSAQLPTALLQTPCLYSEDHHSLTPVFSLRISSAHKHFLHHAFSLHVCVLCDKNMHLLLEEEIIIKVETFQQTFEGKAYLNTHVGARRLLQISIYD